MSDIFMSYSRADLETARRVAHALETHGWSVWWDRQIPAGKSFDKVIEEQITEARCVVVLWSRHSVDSNWVKTEADEGLRRHTLVPISIDGSEPPFAYRRIQAAPLSGWSGENDDTFAPVVAAIRGVLGQPTPGASQDSPRASLAGWERTPSGPPSKPPMRWFAVVGVVVALALGSVVVYQFLFDGCDDRECRAQVTTLLDSAAGRLGDPPFLPVPVGSWEQDEHRLADDQSADHPVTFESGVPYALLAACDNDCREMRIELVGENGLSLAARTTDSSVVLEDLRAGETGSVTIQVHMNDCAAQHCSYGLRLLRRRSSLP